MALTFEFPLFEISTNKTRHFQSRIHRHRTCRKITFSNLISKTTQLSEQIKKEDAEWPKAFRWSFAVLQSTTFHGQLWLNITLKIINMNIKEKSFIDLW